MNKLLLTTALLAFLSFPAMADQDKNTSNPQSQGGTAATSEGGGTQSGTMVQWAEERAARLLDEIEEHGPDYLYGNSKVITLAMALKQTRGQLSYWLEEERKGNLAPYYTKIPNNSKIPACSGSLYC